VEDLDLARRVIAGDEAAAAAFFDAFFPRLHRFAGARLGGDGHAVDDVVQATLILAVRKLHTYRGEAALFTWLCTLCRREVAAWLQRAGRAAEVGLLEDDPPTRQALDMVARSMGVDPEHEAGRRELSQLVQQTLDHLPGRYGAVLEWRYIDGLSVPEIANRLGVGYKAAESLLSRARPAFREAFALVAGVEPPS
jgi:RNA polymerase sigma-70 factor, ECF subfamily